MSINVSTRDGIINNSTVLGTLTTSNVINTPGIKGRNVNLYSSSSQAVFNDAITAVTFPTILFYSMTTDLTLVNTNSKLTYNGTEPRVWDVTYSAGANIVSGALFNCFIMKNGVTRYGQTCVTTYGCATCVLAGSALIPMSQGDYIQLMIYHASSTAAAINVSVNTLQPSVLTILE